MRWFKARLSARGEVLIPKAVRDRLGVGPGDRIAFVERDGEILVRAAPRPRTVDPFGVFAEWAGDADEKAYADL